MGQSGSIIEQCKQQNVTIDEDSCAIKFGSSNNVLQFGEIEPGQLEPNTDIAGQGVLVAFLVPGILVCTFALVLTINGAVTSVLSWKHGRAGTGSNFDRYASSEWLHDTFDDFICSSGDAQLLVILAYGAAFWLSSKCDMSSYHYLVAIHTILTGLATSLLGMLLVHNLREKVFTAIVRGGIFIVCIAGVFSLKAMQESIKNGYNGVTTPLSDNLPGGTQTDSILVLPAYCFMDSTLDPWGRLTDEQKRHLTANGPGSYSAAQAYIITILVIPAAIGKWVGSIRRQRGTTPSHFQAGAQKRLFMQSYLLVYGLVWGLVAWNWASIFILRNWAERSGWLNIEDGKNEERDVQGLGQIAPLIALGAIGLMITDTLSKLVAPKKGNGAKTNSGP